MIIKTDPDEIQNFVLDASNYTGRCDAVYFPENESEIVELIKECNTSRTEITVSGNGTGLTGARVPENGIVLSTERLNKIIVINEKEKYAVVEPGVMLKDFQDEVEARSLFYPPDPTERNCFIGATVSTNSSGARTFKYGPTRDYVLALRVVLPDGEVINISRAQFTADGYNALLSTDSGRIISFRLPRYDMPDTKNAAGYFSKENMDLIDLFIGSEGTLGVITEIKFKLIDLPKEVFSCIAFFESETDALNFIDEARIISSESNNKQSSIATLSARGLEFFDERALKFLIKEYQRIPASSKAAVWFEQEIEAEDDGVTDLWIGLLEKHNCRIDESWIAVGLADENSFKEFRHSISWKVNEYITQKGLRKVGTDVSVPDEMFRDLLNGSKKLVEAENLDYLTYGHFGNSHLHLNMLPNDDSEYIKAKKVYSEICDLAIKLKGTVSAEHGIGKSKRDYLLRMYGEETVRRMAALKLVFDPNRILCIGNIFERKYLD